MTAAQRRLKAWSKMTSEQKLADMDQQNAAINASRFEAECRRRQIRFGLTDWAFRFKVEEGDETKDCQVDMDHDARTAIFTYFTKGEHLDSPEREAAHEVYHVVLVELLEVTVLRGHVEHKDVAREEHRAIERMLNAEGP